MDRDNRRVVSCLDDALKRTDITETDRIILTALRTFVTDQWVPHLAEEEKMRQQLEEVHTVFFVPMAINGDTNLAKYLQNTAIRANIWLDAGCWFVKYGWWIVGSLLGGLIWLIRHHEILGV